MKTKNLLLIMALIIMSFALVACNNNVVINESNDNNNSVSGDVVTEKNNDEIESNGIIKLELYPEIAPETVENFVELANSGYYNGLVFHRVIPGFMAQGGCPEGNGTSGPNYGIYGEFSSNGFENSLKHERGVISMARSDEKNSAGSQFFIMVETAEHLDGEYAAFGKVLEGMDTVDEIVNVDVIRRDIDEALYNKLVSGGEIDEATINEYYKQMMEIDRPVNPPVIKSITVETHGVEYASPMKLTESNSGDVAKIGEKDAARYKDVAQNPVVTIEIQK